MNKRIIAAAIAAATTMPIKAAIFTQEISFCEQGSPLIFSQVEGGIGTFTTELSTDSRSKVFIESDYTPSATSPLEPTAYGSLAQISSSYYRLGERR